jgi:mycothiol synthase
MTPKITWRELSPDDTAALAELDAACRRADGDEPVSNLAGDAADALATSLLNTSCAVLPDDQIVALGWLKSRPGSELSIVLGGRVHPDFRRQGLGTAILEWAEARARQVAGPVQTLTISNEAMTQGAEALYDRHGFSQVFAENMMVYDLSQTILDRPLPAGIRIERWTPDNAALFFSAYQGSFRDRPGFPDPSKEDWIADYAESDSFRPELSILALDEDTPAGFVTCERLSHFGWISQIGAVPAWRRHGLASALLAHALRGLKTAGFEEAGLHVNVNNPKAASVFSQIGFKLRLRRARYVKRLAAARR